MFGKTQCIILAYGQYLEVIKSETVIEGFQVKIYDMEKSVCDAVKYRNRIGIDVSSEILRNYLSRKDSDITRLYAYANAMRLGKRMDELVKYMI